MPPARTLVVPGRGELFLRDTGGDGPVARYAVIRGTPVTDGQTYGVRFVIMPRDAAAACHGGLDE